MMNYDVFICYSPENEKIAVDVCNFLENHDKKCWFKKRDFGENDSVYNITEAIKSSNSLVLIYSNDAKQSNFVTTEIDIAFSSEIPIIVFKTDESTIGGKLQFYLKDKPIINAFPKIKDYYGELLENISQLMDSYSVESTNKNDVFICYADEDLLTAEAACHVLEENSIKCWFKKRDLLAGDTTEKIIESIKNSKSFLLVYSNECLKSNYVRTEIEYALTSNVPMLSFKIDDVEKFDKIADAHWLDAYPNIGDNFDKLVINISNLVKKPVGNPKIDKKYQNHKRESKPIEKPQIDQSSKEFNKNYGIGNNFKKIMIVVIVIALISLAGIYFSTSGFTMLGDDNQIVYNDEGVSLDTKGDLNTLEITLLSISMDKDCELQYKLYTEPDNFDDYTLNLKYFDESGNQIDETTTKMKDISNDNGYLTFSHSCNDVVFSIEETIFDNNGNEVYHGEVS